MPQAQVTTYEVDNSRYGPGPTAVSQSALVLNIPPPVGTGINKITLIYADFPTFGVVRPSDIVAYLPPSEFENHHQLVQTEASVTVGWEINPVVGLVYVSLSVQGEFPGEGEADVSP
jgi:hypothetical protein